MKAIHEYSIPCESPEDVPSEFSFKMPKGATIGTVEVKNNKLIIYALVDTTKPLKKRSFCMKRTHSPLAKGKKYTHIDTFSLFGGDYTYHLLEVKG